MQGDNIKIIKNPRLATYKGRVDKMIFDDTYLIYLMIAITIPALAQMFLMSTFGKYSNVRASSGMTGAQVARRILDSNGLQSVPVVETPGSLSDHYDPRSRTVRLSREIFHGTSLAAVAVAAHEVGHAIQHATSYAPLTFRSAMFPIVNIANKFGYLAIMIGFFAEMMNFAMLGIILVGIVVLFQLVTLPVEFNASTRALRQLDELNVFYSTEEKAGAKKVLTAAALTYVAGAVVAIAELVRYIVLMNRRSND